MILLTCFLSFNSGHEVVIDLYLKQSNISNFSQKVDIRYLELSHPNEALKDVPKLEVLLFRYPIEWIETEDKFFKRQKFSFFFLSVCFCFRTEKIHIFLTNIFN